MLAGQQRGKDAEGQQAGNACAALGEGRGKKRRGLGPATFYGKCILLLRNGYAVAHWRYSQADIMARIEGVGLWQGDFERPEDWGRRYRR